MAGYAGVDGAGAPESGGGEDGDGAPFLSPVSNLVRLLDQETAAAAAAAAGRGAGMPQEMPSHAHMHEAHAARDGAGVGVGVGMTVEVEEALDETVLDYGSAVCLRGISGHFLSADHNIVPEPAAAAPALHAALVGQSSMPSDPFRITAEGQGVGDPRETVVLASTVRREEVRPARYGDEIVLRIPWSRDRCVGVHETADTAVLARVFVGPNERWRIIRAPRNRRRAPATAAAAADHHHHHQYHHHVAGDDGDDDDDETNRSMGQYVRSGDAVLLRSSTGKFLSILESPRGPRLAVVPSPDGIVGDAEMWQLYRARCPRYPHWFVEQSRSVTRKREHHVRPIAEFPAQVQERLLVEDVLSAALGYEGRYIRFKEVTGPAERFDDLSWLRTPAKSMAAKEAHQPMAPPPGEQKHTSLPGMNREFMLLSEGCDLAVAAQASALLDLCNHHLAVQAFIRQHSLYEYGRVSHALCAALRRLVQQHLLLIAEVEKMHRHEQLTLQRLRFLTLPGASCFSVVFRMVHALGDRIGGELVNALYEGMQRQGDENARDVYRFVLEFAAGPFLTMLSEWLYQGKLDDPYDEFMVVEDERLRKEVLEEDFNAQYWDGRYTIRQTHVCCFLAQFQDKILTTGKYLNVVRECGHEIQAPHKRTLSVDLGEPQLQEIVDGTFSFASRTLVRLLLEEHDMLNRLRSLKHFFLLEKGDFFVQFMDLAEEELKKNVSRITASRLESLLHLSMQSSVLANEPYGDELTCTFSPYNLMQHLNMIHAWSEVDAAQRPGNAGGRMGGGVPGAPSSGAQGLKGIEVLMFDYRVQWPMSVVISRRVITKYQLLSRLLFFSKHVERCLHTCWLSDQATKELDVRAVMGNIYSLRQRMLHFLQNFIYYMSIEVVGPGWHELEERIQESVTVDDVNRHHEHFLDKCLKECLLANQDLLRVLIKLMTTCQLFAERMTSLARTNVLDAHKRQQQAESTNAQVPEPIALARQLTASAASDLPRRFALRAERVRVHSDFVTHEVAQEGHVRMIAKFTDTFDDLLTEFIEALWNDSQTHLHGHLSNLVIRIDFNGYFSHKLQEKRRAEALRQREAEELG